MLGSLLLRKYFTWLATGALLVILAVFTAPAEASAAPLVEKAASFSPRTIASKTLSGKSGGLVKAPNGVSIRVPKKVIKTKRARVSIREVQIGVYDIHIAARWSGAVTITLPLTNGQAVIAHRVNGKWRFESAKKVGTLAQATVRSLSLFSAIKDCLSKLRPSGAGVAKAVLICFAKYGLTKFLPEWISKKLFNLFSDYDACKPVSWHNWTIDPLEALLSACKLTEPPVPPSPTPPPPPTNVPQPPAPTNPPAPSTTGFTVEDIFLGGTWARTDIGDGTWYSRGNRPGNAAWWYPNGLGVGVDCAASGAAYGVRFADGHQETWNTWFHVTDGKWMPSAAARETSNNGYYGLRAC